MEERLGVSVDVVQDPVPDDSLLVVNKGYRSMKDSDVGGCLVNYPQNR